MVGFGRLDLGPGCSIRPRRRRTCLSVEPRQPHRIAKIAGFRFYVLVQIYFFLGSSAPWPASVFPFFSRSRLAYVPHGQSMSVTVSDVKVLKRGKHPNEWSVIEKVGTGIRKGRALSGYKAGRG